MSCDRVRRALVGWGSIAFHVLLIGWLVLSAFLLYGAWESAPELYSTKEFVLEREKQRRLNSDTMFPFHVARDVVLEGHSLAGWKFPISPFLIPDVGLFVLTLPWNDEPAIAHFAYSLLQLGLTGLGFLILARLIGLGRSGTVAILLTLIAILFLECCHLLSPLDPTHPPPLAKPFHLGIVTQLFRPQLHAGLFALLPWGMALLLVGWQSNLSRLRLRFIAIGLILLSAAMAISDPLVLPQWLAPVTWVSLLAVMGRWVPVRRMVILWLAVSLGVVVGYALKETAIHSASIETQAGWTFARIRLAWRGFKQGFIESLQQDPFVYGLALAVVVFVLLGGTITLARRWREVDKPSRFPTFVLTLSFFATSGIVSIAALILGGHQELQPGGTGFASLERFLYPYLVAPLFLLPLLVALLCRSIRWLGPILCIGIIIMLGNGYRDVIAHLPAERPSLRTYQPPWVAELDTLLRDRQATLGLADFWDARVITLFSRAGVHALAMTDVLGPFHHLANRDWWESTQPPLDFILLPRIPGIAERIRQRFGEPNERIMFADRQLWLYHKNDRMFRTEFFTQAGWLLPGQHVEYHAAQLPGPIEQQHGTTRSAEEGRHPAGIMQTGPWWSLGRGRYRVELRLTAIASQAEPIARWSLGRLIESPSQVWARGEIRHGQNLVETEFVVPDSKRLVAELRVEWLGKGQLTIESLRLERLE